MLRIHVCFSIDYDPQIIEQKEQSQPTCLPLSYVLRFMTEAARLQNETKLASLQSSAASVQSPSPPAPTSPFPASMSANGPGSVGAITPTSGGGIVSGGTEVKRKLAIKHHTYSLSSSNRSGTPTGSEAMSDEEPVLTESEDSNDSWTTEEFSSEYIMKYGVK